MHRSRYDDKSSYPYLINTTTNTILLNAHYWPLRTSDPQSQSPPIWHAMSVMQYTELNYPHALEYAFIGRHWLGGMP